MGQSDAGILMAQAADTRALLDGIITPIQALASTRKRIDSLEALWQQAGLPRGDATNTLKEVSGHTRSDWREAHQRRAT